MFFTIKFFEKCNNCFKEILMLNKIWANFPFYSAALCSGWKRWGEAECLFPPKSNPQIILQLHKLTHRLHSLNRPNHPLMVIFATLCMLSFLSLWILILRIMLVPCGQIWDWLSINAKKCVDGTQNHLNPRFKKKHWEKSPTFLHKISTLVLTIEQIYLVISL